MFSIWAQSQLSVYRLFSGQIWLRDVRHTTPVEAPESTRGRGRTARPGAIPAVRLATYNGMSSVSSE
jgi:hypothetical protein